MEILAGKAEDDFKRWVKNTYYPSEPVIKVEAILKNMIVSCYCALVIEWMDTVGIYVDPYGLAGLGGTPATFGYDIDVSVKEEYNSEGERYAGRNEATKAALIVAVGLYNARGYKDA